MGHDAHIEEDLARLADGTLPDAEAAQLRARVRESPALQAQLRAQERAIGLARMTGEITAPPAVNAALRERLAPRASRGRRRDRRSARRPALASLTVGALAALLVAIVLISSGSPSLTVARTAPLALASPTRAAPPVDPSDTDQLALRVDSIAFPAYAGRGDWRATGARTDEIAGRRVQTVFYERGGQRVGYSIVPGPALGVPHGQRHQRDGVTYVTGRVDAGGLVTWRHDGHTCVIAGRRATARTLLRLADATQLTT